MTIEPSLRRRLEALSVRSGFSVSSLAALAITRILSEPAIFVPLEVSGGTSGLPRLSRRQQKREKVSA